MKAIYCILVYMLAVVLQFCLAYYSIYFGNELRDLYKFSEVKFTNIYSLLAFIVPFIVSLALLLKNLKIKYIILMLGLYLIWIVVIAILVCYPDKSYNDFFALFALTYSAFAVLQLVGAKFIKHMTYIGYSIYLIFGSLMSWMVYALSLIHI